MNVLSNTEMNQLNEKYNIIHSEANDSNQFLCKAMRMIRSQRNYLETQNVYSFFEAGSFTQLWIQTSPCRYSQIGKCTVCNYWRGNRQPNIIEQLVKDNLLSTKCDTLLINTCGSCLDSYELAIEEQNILFEWISRQRCNKVILETHADTLTLENICRVRQKMSHKKLYYEFGIESISKQVLFYSLNKTLPTDDLRKIIDRIHSVNAYCIVNVLLGAPFLNREEQIEDAVNCIFALLEKGVDYVVLFPVNIKPYTLPAILNSSHKYDAIRADMIVEVLAKVPENMLDRIDVSWYGEHVEKNVISPYYCPDCQSGLKNLIGIYNSKTDYKSRKKVLSGMQKMKCTCNRFSNPYFDKPLFERLNEGYELIQKQVIERDDKGIR